MFWNKTFLRFTLIEWAVALLVVLILARFFWAEKAANFGDSFFESIGLGGDAKYLITVPLGIWVFYSKFKREQAQADLVGRKVIRPQVLAVSVVMLVLAVVFMFVSAVS